MAVIKTTHEYKTHIETRNSKGQLHSFDDQPAVKYTNKFMWYVNGALHRDGNKPAIIDNGKEHFYINGVEQLPVDVQATQRKITEMDVVLKSAEKAAALLQGTLGKQVEASLEEFKSLRAKYNSILSERNALRSKIPNVIKIHYSNLPTDEDFVTGAVSNYVDLNYYSSNC